MNIEYLQNAGSGGAGGGSSSSPPIAESAGIIAYIPGTPRTISKFEISGKVLIGRNCKYDEYGYGSPTGVDIKRWIDESKGIPLLDKDGNQKVIKAKTIREFVEGHDSTKYSDKYKADMLTRLQDAYPVIDLNANLIQEGIRLKINLFDFIKVMLPEGIVNTPIRDQYHLLDKKTGYARAEKGIKFGFPKGGIHLEDKGDLLTTAKREFKEETGFDLDTIPGLKFTPINPGAIKGQYLYFIVIIDDAIAKQIIEAFEGTPISVASSGGGKYIPLSLMPKSGGHRYYSELFDLQFTDDPKNLDDESILTFCLKEGIIKLKTSVKKPGGGSEGPNKDDFILSKLLWKDYLESLGIEPTHHWKYTEPKQSGGHINYEQKIQKYQQKLLKN